MASPATVDSRPQSPDQPPEPNQAAQDSQVSPNARASLLTGSSKEYAGYLMSLQIRQRCTVVAYNERVALCVAVAFADEGSAGLVVHVCDYAHRAGLLNIAPASEAWLKLGVVVAGDTA